MVHYWVAVTTALIGLFVGASAVWAAWVSENKRHRAQVAFSIDEIDPRTLSLISALPGVVIILSEDDTTIHADAAAYALGLLRGSKVTVPELREIVGQVRESGMIVLREIRVLRGRGTTNQHLTVEVRVAPVGAGKVLVLAQDVSAAERMEEVRRDFTANVSHELKTPVGAIALLAETIEQSADDTEAVRHFAGRMMKESARLNALITDIIELSRLQTPGALSEPDLVEAAEIADEAAESQRTAAGAKDIAITTQGEVGLKVWGDADLLTTAVRNLVENAVRYSPSGTEIKVACRRQGDDVMITVSDQGIGIPAEAQRHIFERFYRVNPGRSRQASGTGLGLSIVKHIAADHGGTIAVSSQPGVGFTFTLNITLVQRNCSALVCPEAAPSVKVG